MSKHSEYYNDLTGKAAELLARADQGDAKAQYDFAMYILCEPDASIRRDLEPDDVQRAMHYLKLASAQGVRGGGAAMQLGNIYFSGELVDRDYKQARMWYNTALLKDNPVAACMLGDFAYYGYDCDVNYQEAAEYYIQAAPRYTDAFYRLGDMFLEGRFFVKDRNMAIRLYERVLSSEEKFKQKYGFYSDAHDEAATRLKLAEESMGEGDGTGMAEETKAQAAMREKVLALLGERKDLHG